MNLYCMPHDAANFGAPWQPLQTRHINAAPVWQYGWAGIMCDIEGSYHYNLRPGAMDDAHLASLDFFKAFVAETRAACGAGALIGCHSVPCYWGYDWNSLPPDKRQAIADHWAGVVSTIGVDLLMVQCYQQNPDHALNNAGKLGLGKMVAAATGLPLIAVVTHRTRGTEPGDMGRRLLRGEVDPLIVQLRDVVVDGVYAWNGDTSGLAEACGAAPLTAEARAARRKDMRDELWGDQVPQWRPSAVPRLMHTAAAIRAAFAGWLHYGLEDRNGE